MASSTQFTYGPSNVDSLLATTRSVISQTKDYLNDAIFNKIALLKWLNEKALVTKQGGASILVPLLYGKNNTFRAYSGDDLIDTTGQEGMTMAQAKWKNYGGTIKFDGDEVAMNSGEGKLKDLVKAKTMQAVMSARDALNLDLFASSQATKKVACLPVLVDATSEVQDINSTTNSWWQAQVQASGSFATRGLADLRNLRDLIVRAGQNGAALPDGIITTQLITELYEASQLPALRYANNNEADASFGKLRFSGAMLDFDPNCATGELYMLSSDALEFVVHSQHNWTIGDFLEPTSQDVRVAKVIWRGNLITKNRRRLGKLTGVTA
jgi:hypothetical protein